MQVIRHADNILELYFDRQFDLNSSFIRMQEFYESPFDEFRGKYFTLDQYMDRYVEANVNGVFDYFTYWFGFNLPGNAVLAFNETFSDDLRPKEWELLKPVEDFVQDDNPNFYIIGTFDHKDRERTVAHELAHAHYYLDPAYRKSADTLYACISPEIRAKVATRLIDIGYTEEVIPDETQAYFATDNEEGLRKRFHLSETDDISIAQEFAELYEQQAKITLPE